MGLSHVSALPYFLIMAICFILASRLKWLMPSDYFEKSASQKHQAIEGLRSLLALSVFMGHSVITYFFYQHGRWEPAPSGIYTLLGGVSVNIFFLITGFLFWGKAIQSEGKIGYKTLLQSRIRRIAPAYMASVTIMLLVIFWHTNFAVMEPVGDLLEKMAKLFFGLGLIPVVHHPINGISAATTVGAGVFWTLLYEWKFYLALPLLALLLRKEVPRPVLYCASFAAFIYVVVYNFDQMPLLLLFLCGMFCAALNSVPTTRELLTNSRYLYFAGLASIPAVFLLFDTPRSYASVFLQTLFFVSLVHMRQETIVFKLLQTLPARILGACSYSTYVLHGVILHIGMNVANMFFPIRNAAPLTFWMTIAFIAPIVVVFSVLSYRFVEHPFMLRRVRNGSSINRAITSAPAGRI
jgi:peptidoglycan/LPS O-acetylase OafA/YrhL